MNSLRIRTYWHGLLPLLLLPYAAGQIMFTSKYDGKTVTGLVGSSVNFTWRFNSGVNSVDWGLKQDGVAAIKNGGKLVSLDKDGSMSIPVPSEYSGRVSGSGDVSSGQVTFTLSLIRMSDKGFYGCNIKSSGGFDLPKFDSVYLVVKEAPQISISSVPASYNEGSSVNISCTASGTPDPDVQWIRNGNVKSTRKKTVFVTFNSINRADDGQYTCKANNSAGKDEKQTTLEVHYKPEGTTLNTSAADNTVTQIGSVTFTCHATAAQPQVSRYSFYLNDTTLVKDSNDSQYTINNVQRSQHYGKYKCVPQNDVGDGPEATVILNVNVPAQFTTLPPNKTVNETSPIVLNCDASGFPEPSFTWTKGRQRLSQSRQLNIQRSQRSDAGMYVCTASNGVGKDKTAKIYVTVQYPPTIKAATASTDNKSWIGQTVTLTCESDGVPTPTLTWYKPDGSQIKSVTATQNTVDVKISVVEDFGDYMCNADNGLATADFKIVKIQQIKKPGSPSITQLGIQATSLTVKWTAPADDGGSPITAYRVVILKGSMEIKNVNITDPGTTSWTAGDLMRTTNYTVKVFARNAVFEGPAAEKKARTKYEGVPAAATIDDLPNEVTDDTITLKWSEPQNNGRVITQYTVYQRIVTDGKPGEWIMLKAITSISVRKLTVNLKKGKVYEFVVTAINEFGESLKEPGKFARVMASGVPSAVELNDIPSEVTDNEITLKWSAPENYGRKIEQYTVYKRIVIDGKPGEWIKLEIITDVSVRQLTVKVEQGKECEFVVTASNVHGESKIEDGNIKRVMVKGATIASKNIGRVYVVIEANSNLQPLVPGRMARFFQLPSIEPGANRSSCNETTLHIVYNIIIIVLLIIILVLIISLRRLRIASAISKRNRRNICVGCGGELVLLNTMATETTKRLSGVVPSGDSRTYAAPSTGDYMALHPSTRSWEINREQVKVLKVIGKGAFSQVAKAITWNIGGDEEYSTVAVKMLKANAPDSDRKDLLSELEVMKTLRPHPHVIELIGCVTDSDPLLVLIEYVPYGDLLGYLRKSRGLNDTYFKNPDVKPQTNLTAEQLMRFAWQVADGMFYLSSRKIIHRDLAARNVLVGEGEKCKVTDFGMARNVQQDDIYTKQSRGRLPVKWTAYEALLYGTYTTQSDVWSYGVLLYEILTVGGSPYPGIHAREIARKIQEGFRMPKPKHVDTRLYQIMLKCWEENPSDRPTFANLKDTLKEMERNHRTYVNLKQYDTTLYANVEDLTAE